MPIKSSSNLKNSKLIKIGKNILTNHVKCLKLSSKGTLHLKVLLLSISQLKKSMISLCNQEFLKNSTQPVLTIKYFLNKEILKSHTWDTAPHGQYHIETLFLLLWENQNQRTKCIWVQSHVTILVQRRKKLFVDKLLLEVIFWKELTITQQKLLICQTLTSRALFPLWLRTNLLKNKVK